MDIQDVIKLLEECSALANPWPRTDSRHRLYELGYTRALLASVIADDIVLKQRIIKHSRQVHEKYRAKKP